MTSSSQLLLDNLPGQCCHLGISGISFSDMSGQYTYVVFMFYCTEYISLKVCLWSKGKITLCIFANCCECLSVST